MNNNVMNTIKRRKTESIDNNIDVVYEFVCIWFFLCTLYIGHLEVLHF